MSVGSSERSSDGEEADYRTTFYELCSRHLSRWFTWHLERSYPQGKSDLEFVGKYNEKYANLRWVIEFKHYANAAFKKKFGSTGIQGVDTEPHALARGHLLTRVVLTP